MGHNAQDVARSERANDACHYPSDMGFGDKKKETS